MKAAKLLFFGSSMALLFSCGGGGTTETTASGEEAKKLDGAALGTEYCKCLETEESLDCAQMAINHAVDLASDADQLKIYDETIAPCSEAAEARAMEKLEEDLDAMADEAEENMEEEEYSEEEGEEIE